MCGCMSRHPLYGPGHVYDPARGLLRFIFAFKLRTRLKSLVYRHLQCERYGLCYGVGLRIADIEHPAYIPDSLLGLHRTEGYYLRDLVLAVLFRDVLYDFPAPFVAEVDIYIRHAHTLRIEETLEDQTVLYRIDIRDPQGVRHDAACRRSPARPHHYAVASGVVYEIPYDKEIFHISHALYGGQFVVETLLKRLHLCFSRLSIPLCQTFLTEAPEISFLREPLRHREIRQMQLTEVERHIALLRYLSGIVAGLRDVGEYPAHLVLRLEIELVVGKAHPAVIIDGGPHLYAHQHVLCNGILPSDIVYVIGGNEGYPRLIVELLHIREYPGLFFQPLILQLQIVVPFAEYLQHIQRFLPGAIVITVHQSVLHLSRKAC